ncbi:glycosyltransferase family 2 protein [Thalassotalea sp. G20_0]|uniref:glycosyltransferase family 2 protein n=1 Tax=Thalassotalea sp. G20_0 TaxID=2821093 RepID=UPI001ADBDBD9|nr:glycosyltransferase family 2 protein [Thalassotalea sp. G20_0]MBO9493576.1 glycosyltransferase family 2 protein [Thalassotalea sp. G20_0]
MKKEKETTCAVVVTYNRKEMLVKCLDGLLKQTCPLDEIVIIDNDSTDGTSNFLKSSGYLELSKIHYCLMDDNLGGAGGFHNGLKIAHERGHDWFWLMDDDVIPLNDGLEKLSHYKEQYHALQGQRTDVSGDVITWFQRYDISKGRAVNDETIMRPMLENNGVAKTNCCCFEGLFLSKKAVSTVGLPDSDFFISEDDTYYGFLLGEAFGVYIVPEVTLHKQRSSGEIVIIFNRQKVILSRFYLYYYARNQFLMDSKIYENNSTMRFLSYVKSVLYLTGKFLAYLFLYRDVARSNAILKGIKDGVLGRFGKAKYI